MTRINTINQWRRYVGQKNLGWHCASQQFVQWPLYGNSTGIFSANSLYCATQAHKKGRIQLGRALRRQAGI